MQCFFQSSIDLRILHILLFYAFGIKSNTDFLYLFLSVLKPNEMCLVNIKMERVCIKPDGEVRQDFGTIIL